MDAVIDSVAKVKFGKEAFPIDEVKTFTIQLYQQYPTYLTLASDKDRVNVCDFFTLSGTLKDREGNPMGDMTIKLYLKSAPEDVYLMETTTEPGTGVFTFSLHGENVGKYTFYVVFEGWEDFAPSVSPEVTVSVGLLALTVEVVVKGTTPAVPVVNAAVTYGRLVGTTPEGEETYVWFEKERQTTDVNGKVTFYVEPDVYAVHVSASGFRETVQGSINVTEDTSVKIELEAIPLYEQALPYIVVGGIAYIIFIAVLRRR